MATPGPDVETARRLIATVAAAPSSLRRLGAGEDCVIYLADEEWAYRFPQAPEMADQIRAEIAILPHLQSLPVPVPLPERVGVMEGEHSSPFFGYRLLRGSFLSDVEISRPEPVLAQLWAFLDALHDTPYQPPFDLAKGYAEDPLRSIPHPTAQAVLGFFEANPLPAVASRLCHNDMGMEHVLMDPERGRLTGIIDWGDMTWTDPAVDWVGMVWSFPDVLEAQQGRSQPDRVARAWLHGLRFGLMHCQEQLDMGRSEDEMGPIWAVLQRRLERARRSPVF
ncbi:MAG: phosphotransferase [Myxococcota bacterium]